jgi:hypothetical protein
MSATQYRPDTAPVTLNGDWNLYVHGRLTDVVTVPSSLRPHGFYRLQRSFLLPRLTVQNRAILHFEGITYYAQVWINDKLLGCMVPYVPHEFDFTQAAREGNNRIEVAIVDACQGPEGLGKDALTFGITSGWETYGGIIRDVWAEIRPAAFIENVRFGYKLSENCSTASCSPLVLVDARGPDACEVEVFLSYGNTEVTVARTNFELETGSNQVPLEFSVHAPALWSPDDPNLYAITAKLKTRAGVYDWHGRTGFRQLGIRGSRFELNGEPITLRGICRMELWKDQGFTMTAVQREQDMRGIKKMGANFVRLQPFPHDRGIIELADQLGLLVSEEPGYWWADFRNCPRSFIDLGLDVMERNIRRDWNSPSVMCWFVGNESYFTGNYLKEAKALCNRVDPLQRPVSMAHENAEPPEAKKLFDEAGMDFYDWHAYVFSEDKFEKLPEIFGDSKPLTFSEWGWEDLGNGDIFYERYLDKLLHQVEAGRVAGYMFFDWNHYPQFTRKDWATGKDGILHSGVVDESRHNREPIYSRIAGLFAGRHEFVSATPDIRPRVLPLRSIPFAAAGKVTPLDLEAIAAAEGQLAAWRTLEKKIAAYWEATGYAQDQWARAGRRFRLWRDPDIEIAGAKFRCPLLQDEVRPLLVTDDGPVIPIHRVASQLHFLGQVTFPGGYPATSGRGNIIAEYVLEYKDGHKTALPVREGIECAQANCITGATRILPIATSTQPALQFTKDIAREQYQLLLWSVPTDRRELAGVRCMGKDSTNSLAILAISIEEA